MSSNRKALSKLRKALTSFLKSSKPVPATQSSRKNLPAVRNNNKPRYRPRRSQQYSAQDAFQASNQTRSQIINPDGSIMSVERNSHRAAYRKRNYRERRY